MDFCCQQDLHCHTRLSACAHDDRLTAQVILDHAQKNGYFMQCVTDHLWDADVPGASDWYRPQDLAHIALGRPLPKAPDGLRMLFGCETEYCGGEKLGLTPEHFDLFDFVVIPINHTHMKGFVRPDDVDTEEKMAELMVTRLEELIRLDLPWRKVGLAHLTGRLMYKEGDVAKIYRAMDADRLTACFSFLAEKGAGVELNAGALALWREDPDAWLRLYRLAKRAGCKFYCASDAHCVEGLDGVLTVLPDVARALGLTKAQQYIVP